jgi:hypothetical protein
MDSGTGIAHAASVQRDDVLMRVQRGIGLAPVEGLGTVRRAIFWALLGWVPIAAWALLTGRAHVPGGESLLAHFGVTVRLLLAVPLMVIAETVLAGSVIRLGRQYAASGLLHADPDRLRDVVDGLCRLRDRVHPWAVAAGLAIAWLLAWHETVAAQASHALAWAGEDGREGFGVRWYLWVALPIFMSFVASWLWRTVLLGIALHRIAGSGLRLVPTHPDRAAGLGFAAPLTVGFGLVAFALSAVIAARLAHDVTWHAVHVQDLRAEMVAAVVLLTAVFVAPLVVLLGPMSRARSRACLDYGALAARRGDAVHRYWIEGAAVDDPLPDAPEIGSAADAAALYEAVRRMRRVPLGPPAVLAVLVPAAVPMLAVLAIEMPIGQMLHTLVKALV